MGYRRFAILHDVLYLIRSTSHWIVRIRSGGRPRERPVQLAWVIVSRGPIRFCVMLLTVQAFKNVQDWFVAPHAQPDGHIAIYQYA